MIRPAFDDEEEKPLDPAVEKVRKKLVRFVAINLGLLFVALMAVVGAIVYKARTERRRRRRRRRSSDIPVPAGSVAGGRDRAARRRQDRLAVAVRQPALARRRTCRRRRAIHPLRHRRAPHRRPLRGHREMSGPLNPLRRDASRPSRWSSPTMTRRSPGTRESSASRCSRTSISAAASAG